MMTRTKASGDVEITSHDIFDGIFCLMVMRGHSGIDIETHTSEHYYAYDAACEAVSRRVKELCDADPKKVCTFIIRCDMYGISETARDQIHSWLRFGGAHLRTNGHGYIFFDMNADWAEETLKRQITATGFSREVYEDLTKIFLSIYTP
jgi:hypothetical protein